MTNVLLPGKGLKEGPFVSEEELLALADVAVEDDVIEEEERDLIESIIEFGDTVVREVMVPRPDMVTVSGEFRVDDAMEVMILNGLSRVPAVGEGIDDIVGVVYAKDLMRAGRDGKGERPVSELMRAARFVPETKRIAELLPEMQADHVHLAVVVDEYGGTAGLVTLEDLIEELVGEIDDEYDREEPKVERLGDDELRVNAAMPIDEVNELIRPPLPEDGDWDTVGGLIFHLLGHVPGRGRVGRVRRAPAVGRAGAAASHRAGAHRPRRAGRGRSREPGQGTAAGDRRRVDRERVVRSGFVTIVGRPNVGKSTLVNRILGTKVTIVSDKPQTTRTQVRGVLNRPDVQVVFVDTPGHPQAAHPARRAPERHGLRDHRRRRRRVPGGRRHRLDRPGGPLRRPRGCRATGW